ncbi:hypothetical protein HHI36_015092 [Cryptolaemus montrouzieri]|uniref:Cathepsin L n=1 Tax=Cryptolaemus montrouzieri TaxID=559131 RepID=A0ABD2N4Y5_9CUCU
MKIIALCLVVFVVCAHADEVQQKWRDFQVKYGKVYRSPIEERKRLIIFEENLNKIETHNALYEQGRVSYKKGITKFTDWTKDEFLEYVNRGLLNKPKVGGNVYTINDNAVAPDSVDWRQQGAVTPVKDQGNCGSCWAFSTTGSIEGQLALVENTSVSLSEQNLVDCSYVDLNSGCNGGEMPNAFLYVMRYGIEKEEDYPYTGKFSPCLAKPSKVFTKISSYVELPATDEEALKNAIAFIGPISVSIDATDELQNYSSGIFNDDSCDPQILNHGVLAVGYGTENGTDFYIIKNSWGESWGENGYFRFVRNQGNRCGIASDSSYPVL